MPSLAHELRHCILCRSENLREVVPLRPIPIATPAVIVPAELRGLEATYSAVPLNLNLCRDCGQLQVSHIPDKQFEYRNFAYRTANSLGLRRHFASTAAAVMDRYAPARDGFVVEIGSNDGTFLRNYRDAGMRVLGVDPATAIVESATASGIETLPEFFTADLARRIRAERGPADLVLSTFTTANIEDMPDLAEGVRILLAPGGVAVVETQYGADVVEQNLLDTVYHEHLSYFMVTPLARHYARHGLEAIDVERVPSKGGSIRLTLQLAGGARPVAAGVAALMDEEERKGAFTPEYYAKLPAWIDEIRKELADLVRAERAAGRPVGGWGVSIGTSALLQQFDLGEEIDFLVDDDPHKERELVGPGYRIPIVSIEEFYERRAGAVVVFAWRYIAPIMEKHGRYLDEGGKFIVPLPHLSVVDRERRQAPNTIAV